MERLQLPAEDGVAGANLSSLRSDATSGFFDADAVDSNIVVDSDASEIEFRHRTSSSVVASPQVEVRGGSKRCVPSSWNCCKSIITLGQKKK